MTVDEIPYERVTIAKAQDFTLRFRVLAPEKVELTAAVAASATSLTVKPLAAALANADKLLFGENTVVTLSTAAAAGATTVAVDAIPGPLKSGDKGQKIRDLTGYTIEFEALTNRGDATPVIANSAVTVTVLTQTGADRGHVDVAGQAAVTAALEPKTYYFALWLRVIGSSRPIAEGDFTIVEKGFL